MLPRARPPTVAKRPATYHPAAPSPTTAATCPAPISGDAGLASGAERASATPGPVRGPTDPNSPPM